ncbi:MAG: protein kinase [Isosphaeraceae bacterium]|nr:protein kinase [Isosphaeraceae bacterium]
MMEGDRAAKRCLVLSIVDLCHGLDDREMEVVLDRECGDDQALRDEVRMIADQAMLAVSHPLFVPLEPPPMDGEDATTELESAREAPSRAEPPGIGRFLDRRPLHGGGQGRAVRAFDRLLGRTVVLKQYHRRGDGRREAEALARVKSPHVVEYLGMGEDRGQSVLILEELEGKDLARYRASGPIALEEVVRIMREIARGVAAIHAAGLIHRDLKPSNVMLDAKGRSRVIDLGLATLADDPSLDRVGSPGYLAPEQATDSPGPITLRTDVFGLGAILFELLTGRAPHDGPASRKWIDAAEGVRLRPGALVPGIPRAIEEVCVRALATDPARRFASALDFEKALKEAWKRETRSRTALHWGVAIAAVLSIAAILIALPAATRGLRNESQPAVVAPLTTRLDAHLYQRDEQGKDRWIRRLEGRMPIDRPVRVGDRIRLIVEASRPTYFSLISLEPDGRIAECLGVRDRPVAAWDSTADGSKLFQTGDLDGRIAFILVCSDTPLPDFDSWRAKSFADLKWPGLGRDHEFLRWSSFDPGSTLRGPGGLVEADPHLELIDFGIEFSRMEGVTSVHAIGFSLFPGEDQIK